MEKRLNRRDFLKTTGGLAGATGICVGGLVSSPRGVLGSVNPPLWDEAADVVVIGSGFAGLAAALEARIAGASVILMEKMGVAGGNSTINGGVFAVAGSPLQKKQGIADSPELLLQDMRKAGLNLNHLDLARMVAYRSSEVLQWTIDYLGVEYRDTLIRLGGHCVPRTYTTHNHSGSAIIRQQLKKLKELGVAVKTKRLLRQLVQDPDGRIVGVKIRRGYRFPDENSGDEMHIKARKAVVLATGGFSSDVAMRTIQDPKLTADVDTTNQPGATAEAFLEALKIGATPVQPSWIQLAPWTSPDEKGMGIAPGFIIMACLNHGVMVDPATGKRFVDELADRKIRADAIINTGHPCIAIADSQGAGHAGSVLPKLLKRGVVKQFNSLKDLAVSYKIPSHRLKETVDTHNSYLSQGVDKDFGKKFLTDTKPIEKAPFYGARVWPKVHHTMGGIQINKKAAVVGLDHIPIKGLYAAGELAGGIHGAVRLGSCAIVDCLVFGRIAGKNAAAERPWP